MTYIANAKDSNGKPIFRPSNDTKEYILLNGKKMVVVCSYYRKVKSKEDGVIEKIEIRAAEHGTTLRTWCNYRWQEPQKNRQNLDISFTDNGIPNNDLKCNKFFVVEQYAYRNNDLTPSELQLILDKILEMPNSKFEDPLNKAEYKVLTPTDFDGNPLEVPAEGVHPNQLDALKRYKEHNTESKQYTNMNRNIIRLTEGDLHRIVKESVNMVLNEKTASYYEVAMSILHAMIKALGSNDINYLCQLNTYLQDKINALQQQQQPMQQPQQPQGIQQQPMQPQQQPQIPDALKQFYERNRQRKQQGMQQPMQQPQQAQPMQPQGQQPMQQPSSTNNNSMIDNQVQQQMQRNMALQQQMANRIRQQKMAKYNQNY